MGPILRDVYQQLRVNYRPQQSDEIAYFNILDNNKDRVVSLEDMEQICIRYLCNQGSAQVSNNTITTSYKPQQNGNNYTTTTTVRVSQHGSPHHQSPSASMQRTIVTSPPQQYVKQQSYQQQQQYPPYQGQTYQQPRVASIVGESKRPMGVSNTEYLKQKIDEKISQHFTKKPAVKVPQGNSKFNSKILFQKISSECHLTEEHRCELMHKFMTKPPEEVKHKCGSKQQHQLHQCEESGRNFVDQEFPPNLNSISQTGAWFDGDDVPHRDWIRAHDYFKGDYQLFADGIMPGDIMQGELGDCYFQCTLAAIAEWPERIQRLFTTQEANKYGVYSVWIVWSGVKQEVILDDYLWYNKGQNQLVSMTTNGNEIWAQLLEKAWAKVNGDFMRIDGGFARDSLHDLTGAPVIHYRIKEANRWQHWENILWEQLLGGEKADFIMCAGTYPGEDSDGNLLGDAYERDGIFYSHAYSILAAYEVNVQGKMTRLIKFRNPHGEGEWRGKFSDKDQVWNIVSPQEKKRIGMNDEDDGVFFMEYSLLRDYFEDVQICQYRDFYEYEGIKVESQQGEVPHFFEVNVPVKGYYYFQVNQEAKAQFDEYSSYRYTKATVNVVDARGQLISAATGRQKNITSYKAQQRPKEIEAGTYYVYASVLFDQNQAKEKIHSFGFGVYGKGLATIKQIQPPGNIANVLRNASDEILPNFVI